VPVCSLFVVFTRVLWPLSASNLPDGVTLEQLPLGPNVKVVPWVDYNDVLGEPGPTVKVCATNA
jgi:hypothetical protein